MFSQRISRQSASGQSMRAKRHWVFRLIFICHPSIEIIQCSFHSSELKPTLALQSQHLTTWDLYEKGKKKRWLFFFSPKKTPFFILYIFLFSCHHSLQSNRDEIPQESKYSQTRAKANEEVSFNVRRGTRYVCWSKFRRGVFSEVKWRALSLCNKISAVKTWCQTT